MWWSPNPGTPSYTSPITDARSAAATSHMLGSECHRWSAPKIPEGTRCTHAQEPCTGHAPGPPGGLASGASAKGAVCVGASCVCEWM